MSFFDSLLSGVVGPLLVALVLALAAVAVPSSRWTRALKRETEVFNGLPPGDEREKWRERVEAQAVRLRLYQQQVLMWERLVGWLTVAVLCLLLYLALLGKWPTAPANWWEWFTTPLACGAFIYVAWRTLLGLPFFTNASPEMKAARKRVRRLRKAD